MQKDDGSLVAGIFTTYNGRPLSSGDHYLIEERGSNEIIVRQPTGAGTSLLIQALPGWSTSQQVQVWAYAVNDQPIMRVPTTADANGISFVYRQKEVDQAVSYYRITRMLPGNFLPWILRK